MKVSKIKHAVSAFLAICLIISTMVGFCCSVMATTSLGDMNEDGKVNSLDINLLKRVLCGVLEMSSISKEVADMNGDSLVNSVDSNYLCRFVAGLAVTDPTPDEPEYTSPTLVVNGASAAAGETVTVTVDLKNNPGILAMQLALSYDDSALTLTKIANGSALSVLTLTKPGVYQSPCNVVWDGVELSEADIVDGTAVTFTFEIADGAAQGEYDICLTAYSNSVIDNDLNTVDLDIVNGCITVE